MAKKIHDETLLEMVRDNKLQKDMAKFFGVSDAAISKRLKKLLPPPDLSNLTDKQRAFAAEVASGKNPTASALAVYDCKNRYSAKALASNMMKNPDINAGIAALMDYHGLTRSYRVGKLRQHVDHVDPNVSLKALDQTWRLEGGYTERHVNVNIDYAAVTKRLAEIREEKAKLLREIYGEQEEHEGADGE